MPFQPVPNAAKVAIEGRFQLEPVIITLGFVTGVEPGAQDIEDLAVAVGSSFLAGGMPHLPVDYVYEQTVATALHAAIAPQFTSDANSGQTGALISAPSPNNVTLCISFRTGLTGRSARGRNYWPGFLESDVNNNRVEFARANAIVGWYESLVGVNAVINGWTWCVISRRFNNAIRPAGVTFPITQVVLVDNIVDSQRRRLPGRGA